MEQRIINFKAKRLDNGKWAKGSLCKSQFGTQIRWWEDSIEYYAYVDPSTVCQFTGLKTKDGTPIYEGDILSNEPFLKGEVSSYKGCLIVLRPDDSYVPLYEYINCEEPDVVKLEHKGSKFDRKEGEK